jgi:hypothetical protein
MSDCMQNQRRAPKITTLSWGRIATEAGVFRDAKLWPGGGRNWDWTETGTDHDIGLQPADIEELLDHGATIIVVGRGQHERLSVPRGAVSTAERVGARMEVLPTKAAVERYNALAGQGELVGALIHTTC